jgi:hypothetical protein
VVRKQVNESRELCDAVIMVARPCIDLFIGSIAAETDGGLLRKVDGWMKSQQKFKHPSRHDPALALRGWSVRAGPAVSKRPRGTQPQGRRPLGPMGLSGPNHAWRTRVEYLCKGCTGVLALRMLLGCPARPPSGPGFFCVLEVRPALAREPNWPGALGHVFREATPPACTLNLSVAGGLWLRWRGIPGCRWQQPNRGTTGRLPNQPPVAAVQLVLQAGRDGACTCVSFANCKRAAGFIQEFTCRKLLTLWLWWWHDWLCLCNVL